MNDIAQIVGTCDEHEECTKIRLVAMSDVVVEDVVVHEAGTELGASHMHSSIDSAIRLSTEMPAQDEGGNPIAPAPWTAEALEAYAEAYPEAAPEPERPEPERPEPEEDDAEPEA